MERPARLHDGGELLAAVPTTVTYNGTVWIWGPR
jgi:hypothetical protein